MVNEFSFTKDDLVDNLLIVPDARIMEFSIEDNNGNLVLPSRYYDMHLGQTRVDFSGWTIEGTWWVREIFVYPGKDASPGIELNRYLLEMYLLKSDGEYISETKGSASFLIEQKRNSPILGSQFYASEQSQLVSGEIIPAIIPANGNMRQYIWTSSISSGIEGILYQFQVWVNDTIIYDHIQDSLNFAQNSRFQGNAFYFPENLPAVSKNQIKNNYNWRVRASYKIKDEKGNLYWSNWSKFFPFTVNTPPGTPIELCVKVEEVT